MDRVNLGAHANTDLGSGLYVSKPGSNVMNPEFAVSGNLMFDTNDPISTLNVIQSGNFKITCDRIGLSSIGKYDSDGRPQEPIWNSYHESLGYVAENSKAKLVNYLDTGMATIPIVDPLPYGEIPEVAIRFAVGNSSGHFHPWYANVSMDQPDSKNWDEFTYTDSSEVVHMDSPWIRMKWGGIGNEAYTGMHMSHKTEALLAEINATIDGTSARTEILESLRLDTGLPFEEIEAELKKQEDAMKVFSTGMGNIQGLVGLIQYANSTHFTVNAFMTPTHSGLRDYSHNAIDDYNNWHHPITDENVGQVVRPAGFAPRRGGWVPSRSEDNWLTSHIHPTAGGSIYQITLAYEIQDRKFRELPGYTMALPLPASPLGTIWDGVVSLEEPYTGPGSTGFGFGFPNYGFYTGGPHLHEFPWVAFKHLPMVETFQSYGNKAWHHYDQRLATWYNTIDYTPGATADQIEYYKTFPEPARGYDSLQRDHAKEDIYGWKGHPTQFFVNPFSNNMCTFSTHMAPGDTTTSAQDAAYTGSMGLGGAGSKTAMKTDDCWDTFYCSYVIYNQGAILPTDGPAEPVASRAPSSPGEASSAAWRGYWNGSTATEDTPNIINNFIFPDDIVGTVGNNTTDPFVGHRDSAGKIFGNLHFTLELEAGKSYGSDLFSSTTNKPLPAITLDFSASKWNFNDSKNISLSIINSAQIIGGGGAGGHGIRRYALQPAVKSGDVAAGGHGGGGGGAGAGTGRNLDTANSEIDLGYIGTGFFGRGWGQGRLEGDEHILGQSGTGGTKFTGAGSGGARALQLSLINDGDLARSISIETFAQGTNGGDAIGIIHPGGIEPVISITNLGSGVIAGGGGGGAGGYEVDGGDGGALGSHGETTSGLPSKIFNGGNPGYIVGSTSDTYTRPVFIATSGSGYVQGRNPDIPSYDTSNTSGGIAGGWLLSGNNISSYRVMAIGPISTLSANTDPEDD